MTEVILTYGAGGAQGGPVLRQLLAAGHRVRALVRDPAKNRALAEAGAEVVAGDLADFDSVARASAGVDEVFLMLPFSGGGNPLDYASNAVRAAREAGVKLLVLNTSGQTPKAPTGLPMLDVRIALEELIAQSGVPSVVLRPTAYMENFLGPWVLPRLRAEGVLPYPVEAERATSWLAAEDLGRFAVAALGRPDLAGRAFDLGGPQALRGDQIAQAFTAALGRPVRYEAISPEAFGQIMGRVLGLQAEADVTAAYRAGAAAPPDATVVDMAPVRAELPVQQTTLEEWVQAHASAFAPVSA